MCFLQPVDRLILPLFLNKKHIVTESLTQWTQSTSRRRSSSQRRTWFQPPSHRIDRFVYGLVAEALQTTQTSWTLQRSALWMWSLTRCKSMRPAQCGPMCQTVPGCGRLASWWAVKHIYTNTQMFWNVWCGWSQGDFKSYFVLGGGQPFANAQCMSLWHWGRFFLWYDWY